MAGLKTYRAKSVRISMQSDQNAINASPKWFTIPAADCTIKATENLETINIVSAGGEPNPTMLNGIEDISGGITFNLQYPLMAWLFGVSIGVATTVTDAAQGNWTASTAYTVGEIINGTTPGTDDLVAFQITGAGKSGLVAPNTTALSDRNLIVDNQIEWAARKGALKKYNGALKSCNDFFVVEVVVEADCQVETLYYRKLGCKVNSLDMNFDKNTGILSASINVMGSISQSNIKADGTLDATYKDLSTIAGNKEIVLQEERFVKKGELDFTIDGVASDTVESFSITIANSLTSKNRLSKTDGEDTKMIYAENKKVISGTISGMFSTVIQGAMDGTSTRPIVISADSEVGDKFSITLPKAKYSKSEPDFNQSALILAPNWNAEPVTGGSALEYSTTSLSVPYK